MSNIFLDEGNLVKTPVAALRIGMFVTKLDRPWLETPFLIQGFVIHNQAEIRKLREVCDYVYVEKQGRNWTEKANPFQSPMKAPKRHKAGLHESHLANHSSSSGRKSAAYGLKDRAKYPISTLAFDEHKEARKTHEFAKKTVTDILGQARLGSAIETDNAKVLVNQCVNSIMRNPDALMWMGRIKHADQYTLEHCLNVSILAIAFGRHLRLELPEIEKLGMCGLLHDIGKMQIPDEILNKPSKLTEAEFKAMRAHPVIGRDLLMKRKDVMVHVVDTTLNHHERIDGRGYPRQLKPHEISSNARIISIVDAFDAMTSDRCYDKSRSNMEALKEIYNNRGTQFDETLALEFIQFVGPYPPGTIVELKNGCVGIVISSEEKKRHLPTIRVLLDQQKKICEQYVLNLLDIQDGTVDKTYLIAKVVADGTYGIRLEEHTDETVSIIKTLGEEN